MLLCVVAAPPKVDVNLSVQGRVKGECCVERVGGVAVCENGKVIWQCFSHARYCQVAVQKAGILALCLRVCLACHHKRADRGRGGLPRNDGLRMTVCP